MKNWRVLAGAVLGLAVMRPAWAGNLVLTETAAVDGFGVARTRFSKTERVGGRVQGVAREAGETIRYEFVIKDPAGVEKGRWTGNSGVGAAGVFGAQITGVPIESLFSSAGTYTLVATVQAGAESATGSAAFEVVSPVVTLLYPPDGAANLADNPLTFRWSGTGAARYGVRVGEAGFVRTVWRGQTGGAETELSFPVQSPNPLERLTAGLEYWWEVTGQDAQGAEIARSPLPSRFSISGSGGQAGIRDVAVTGLRYDAEHGRLVVTVKNGGTTAEPTLRVSVYVNGAPAGEATIGSLGAGQETEVLVPWAGPADGDASAGHGKSVQVSAVVQLLDANPSNNLMGIVLQMPESEGAKILGRVLDAEGSGESGGIEGAEVEYEGPAKGDVKTNPGGHYKIEKLPLGTYTLKAEAEGYEEASVKVEVAKKQAYANVNLVLKPSKKFGLGEAAGLIEKQGAVSQAAGEKLAGWRCVEIEGKGERGVQRALRWLAAGKGQIMKVELKDED